MSGTARLFFALWPDEARRTRIVETCRTVDLGDGRVIRPHNLHATLVFLGSVEAERRAAIEAAVTTLRAAPVEFALTMIEWKRRTGIVWLTATDIPAELTALVASVRAVLAQCGQAIEARPFRLHVTVARDARRGPRQQPIEPIRWRASEICLASSRPTSVGSEYTVERRWPLS